ncbi:hypothetical protein GCM10018785_32870 [Streptomyces longispororuber]|uniref:DUF3592 domain-containing protein n=1 Tax=Streptomyces longispororuber TaxID=68230 RepID=A0A918ZPW0_9ACTN|nr:DUF3592 domain-containing protein [Streptomyces longispororuber]GHE61246.1 hypothetical protein GCM10018785_32870 [Streptomyces longispororuber]
MADPLHVLPRLFFLALPLVLAAAVVGTAVVVVRRSAGLRQAWRSGLSARGRCLRAYTTTSGHGGTNGRVSTTLHHVYEFTTHDGDVIRFDEENGPSTTVEGDVVTVYYAAGRPERATAHAPRPFRTTAGTVAALCFLGLMLVVILTSLTDALIPDGSHDVDAPDVEQPWGDPASGGAPWEESGTGMP